jgi:hypothetical protein
MLRRASCAVVELGLGLAVMGCGPAAVRAPVDDPPPEPALVLAPGHLGPLTPDTPANLVALRRALLGYEVVPVNLDLSSGPTLEFHVYRRGERVFEIVPSGPRILNVHVVSPKVRVEGHPWQVGRPFSGGGLTGCDCWGERPVCFARGEHVGVAFARRCRGLETEAGRRRLEDKTIEWLVWRPVAFTKGGVDRVELPDDEDEDEAP